MAAGFELRALDAGVARLGRPGEEAVYELGLKNLRRLLAALPPEQHASAVASFVVGAGEGAQAEVVEVGLDRLLPRIVGEEPDPRPWRRPLAGGALHLQLALEGEHTLRLLGPMELVRSGHGVRACEVAAMKQLAARSVGIQPLDYGGGMSGIEGDDGLDAARLLLAERWGQGGRGVLAVVPGRDLLVFTPVVGPRSAAIALDMGVWAAQAVQEQPWPLSAGLFWKYSGGLARVEIEPGPPPRMRVPRALGALLR